MTCPQCHQTLADRAKFCPRCGLSLAQEPPATIIAPAPPADPMLGRVLEGKYELLARLGEGGMGAVYRARRVHIGDQVALKVLHTRVAADGQALERFRREARAAAALRHPNIVAIYDYGEARDDAPAFIVMELVEGHSLRDLLKRDGRMEAERAVALMRDVCAGVGAAHRAGIVHRDLKPDNLIVLPPGSLLEHETVKVVDFGIAKLRDAAGEQAITQAGAVIGTPYYMSPEQCRAEPLDPRADVYSLGAMLYEMLSGRPPFFEGTATSVVLKHLTEPPPPLPPQLAVPPALQAAIMRALAKDREARQPDANAFARELQAARVSAATTPIEANLTVPDSGGPPGPTGHGAAPTPPTQTYPPPPHYPPPQPAGPPSNYVTMVDGPRRSRAGLVVAAVALTAVLLAGAGGAYWWVNRDRGVGNRNRPNSNVATNTRRENANVSLPTANGNVGTTTPPVSLPTNVQSAEAKIVRGTLLRDTDVADVSPANLRLLRNTVYARHGRTFDSPDLQAYFNSRPWYQPRYDYRDDDLTANDRANVDLLRAAEGDAAPPPNAAEIRAEVIETLEEWADSIRERDIDEHMSFYADRLDTYYKRGGVSADVVRRERSQAFATFDSLDVRLSNFKVTPDSGGARATAEFDKTWRFEGARTSTGAVRQVLMLVKTGGEWRIVGEKDLQIY